MPQWGVWMLIGLIYLIISAVLNFIPIINIIVPTLLAPLFTAGLVLGAHHIYKGEKIEIGQLFAGFSVPKSNQLFIVGAITIVASLLMLLVVFLFVGSDFLTAIFAGGQPDPAVLAKMTGKMLLLIPLGFIASILFMLIFWFPPILIARHDLSAIDAIKIGFKGAMKNLGAVIVFVLMLIVVAIALAIVFGIITFILGIISTKLSMLTVILLAIPLALLGVGFWAGTTYHAYHDIFLGQEQSTNQ